MQLPLKVNKIVAFFDKLKSVQLSIFSGNKQTTNIQQNYGPYIDLRGATPEVVETLTRSIAKSFEKKGALILIDKQEQFELLEKSLEKNRELITFFQDKISRADLDILRIAIAIRESHISGDSIKVRELKDQVVRNYGIRANNISNLCSEGYFESHLKPLYDDYQKKYSGLELYKEYDKAFSDIVQNEPFTVFVGISTKQNEIEQEITVKLHTFTKYGAKRLNIHGIGPHNKEKIKICLSKMRDELTKLKVEYLESQVGNSFHVELFRS